jgi:hypothetical protein
MVGDASGGETAPDVSSAPKVERLVKIGEDSVRTGAAGGDKTECERCRPA